MPLGLASSGRSTTGGGSSIPGHCHYASIRGSPCLPITIFALSVNGFARATPSLQPVVLAYASYGVLLFAGLIVAGWWVARRRADVAVMAAAVWVPLGALLAIAINQPIADLVGEARPYDALPDIFVLAERRRSVLCQ